MEVDFESLRAAAIEAAAAEHIDGREVLGRLHRVVGREDHDRGPEPDPFGEGGRGAELRCIETRPTGGDLQRTLLAGAARAAMVAGEGADYQALCREPGAAAQ